MIFQLLLTLAFEFQDGKTLSFSFQALLLKARGELSLSLQLKLALCFLLTLEFQQTSKKPKLSDVAKELQSGLCQALAALNQIDPTALKQWLSDPDHRHMGHADRALIEHVYMSLLPISRELDQVFDTLEKAGEQIGLLDQHQFRVDDRPMVQQPQTLSLVER